MCEADCHLFHYEQGAFAQLSGLVADLISGDGGVITVEHLRGSIRPENEHFLRTAAICIENTHNRWGGRIQPQDEVVKVCEWAKKHQLRTHLDGARLWNAAAATGMSEKELAAPFDSVSVCFSKGLGAPVGSALVGSKEFVYEARRARKLFGGAMRQAGILAACAVHALEHHRERLSEDHAHAKQLADAIESCDALSLRGGRVDTNMVIFEIDPQHSTASRFWSELESRGVRCFDIGPTAIRLVTHLDVTSAQIDQACSAIAEVANAKLAETA